MISRSSLFLQRPLGFIRGRALCRSNINLPALHGVSCMSTNTLQMPKLMSAKNGSLDKWIKSEGQSFEKGESLAEITLDGITIGLQLKEPGVLVKHLINEGQIVDIGEDIAIVADSQDGYLEYLDALRITTAETEELMELAEERMRAAQVVPNHINILRHIKHMIQHGALEDDTEFVQALLALAQADDKHLMDLFESSYDGPIYNELTFDDDFFIDNVEILLKMKAPRGPAGVSSLKDPSVTAPKKP